MNCNITSHVTPYTTPSCRQVIQESLDNAKVSARQQCVYEGPQRRNIQQVNARNIMLKSTFSGLECCRWWYGSIFFHLDAVGSQLRNAAKFWKNWNL